MANENRTQDAGHALLRQGWNPKVRKNSGVIARYGSLYSTRLLVKPGITGPWQVSGRSDLSQEQSEYLDVSYIENWSIAGDLAILAKTVLVVFRGTGSY